MCCSDPDLLVLHVDVKGQVCMWLVALSAGPHVEGAGRPLTCDCMATTVLSFSPSRQIEQLLELLTTEILNPDSQAPNGVKSHFLEIFLEELTKVGAAEVR